VNDKIIVLMVGIYIRVRMMSDGMFVRSISYNWFVLVSWWLWICCSCWVLVVVSVMGLFFGGEDGLFLFFDVVGEFVDVCWVFEECLDCGDYDVVCEVGMGVVVYEL